VTKQNAQLSPGATIAVLIVDEVTHSVMAGLVPRLSGSIFVDAVHGMESSAF
jgi:hypothetical protein